MIKQSHKNDLSVQCIIHMHLKYAADVWYLDLDG